MEEKRGRMVDWLVASGTLCSPRLEQALRAVPRHPFLPEALRDDAYLDEAVPIGEGQTISAPHMVAMMAEALDVRPGHRVLEVGGGSGYHAAILAHLADPGGVVHTMEVVETLAHRAATSLASLPQAAPVHVHVGDGSRGLPDEAPFDRISVAAAAPAVPPPLVEQLAPGGVLVIPVGSRSLQQLTRVSKEDDGALVQVPLGPCVFVPLVGEHGFQR